jgi:predicted metalloendopeptidase
MLNQPVDRSAWSVPPITVNAFFQYRADQMVLPAGILLPPFFDSRRAEVANIGALGSVVGHEITHGFDSAGRLFDAQGVLRDWWTEATASDFEERAQCLVDQYSRFEVLPGHTVDGQLTLAENIADAGGLLLAHDVFLERAASSPAQEGYGAEQQFFISFAQRECEARRPESTLTLLEADSHAPAAARVNATLANVPEFASAFQCAANAPMVNPTPCSVW